MPPADKPTVTQLEPRGIQRGVESKIKLTGTNLAEVLQLKIANPKLKGELLTDTEQTNEAWIKLTAAADLARGPYEFSLANTNGESGNGENLRGRFAAGFRARVGEGGAVSEVARGFLGNLRQSG